MEQEQPIKNAIAAIRVSTVRQGIQGDSPEAQKEQIKQYAQNHNINIKKYFIFLESGSKEEQPVQEAIDYCKLANNNIQLFIVKSIDRFTRGGSYFYEDLKMQLDRHDVQLVDIYGVIGTHQVNTLEHLGVAFKWSVYSPTKKAEMLEAERAKDEMRDIMSRMIGAEIRYARMGYWVRKPPFGFINEQLETPNGKRTILKPHPTESIWIKKMFELRCRGTLSDDQIVEEVNALGFKTRVDNIRDRNDRTKIVKQRGGSKLYLKRFWGYLKNPLYAGINYVNWTKDNLHKGKFEELVSIDMFNKANRGKISIIEENGEIKIKTWKAPEYLLKKGVRNPDFPYKRVVMCPYCERPLFGSASRGKMGKYYPAYHCNKRGHYFRVPTEDFNKTILKFIQSIRLKPGYTNTLVEAVVSEWEKRQNESNKDRVNIDEQVAELKTQAKLTADKIRYLSSEVAIKYIEADIVKIEGDIQNLLSQKEKATHDKPTDMKIVMAYIKYFLEHLEYLLLDQPDPVNRASYFGVLFDTAPTYQELISGTQKKAECIKLNDAFMLSQNHLAEKAGFEPAIDFRLYTLSRRTHSTTMRLLLNYKM